MSTTALPVSHTTATPNTTFTSRSVLVTADLPTSQPAPGFDQNRQFNAGTIGTDISPFFDLSIFHMSSPVFRPHPHAGFSAVTYMFEDSPGTFSNRWSQGDATTISPGTLHWTQAGAGMMHEEIPLRPGTTCHGLQMFVKLAADDELCNPAAFHVEAADIVELRPTAGVRIRLLAGDLDDATAGIDILQELTFAEIHLDPGATVTVPAPLDHNAFVYVQDGTVVSGSATVAAGGAAVFAHDGGHVTITARTDNADTSSFLFGSGRPLDMDLYTSGPFIMSSPERLEAAYAAYRNGDMGHLEPSF